MDKLLDEMQDKCSEALKDIQKARNGNKSAAARLRKFTLDMGNTTGKEFRKESVGK